ncbi:hypothetical protein [Paenibacillus sp. RC67]|uniref:hypothetical protein n=1 Tax=Paenibacillus sp. RC67 TaxID=3039392 RepID=UPI0024AD4C9D|nr:hypothetical protein [Paenibacillus sp. RC67]
MTSRSNHGCLLFESSLGLDRGSAVAFSYVSFSSSEIYFEKEGNTRHYEEVLVEPFSSV